FPLSALIRRHPVDKRVLVTDAEPAGREPPLPCPTDRGAVAPAVRVAAASTVTRVMDAVQERPAGHVPRIAPLDCGGSCPVDGVPGTAARLTPRHSLISIRVPSVPSATSSRC